MLPLGSRTLRSKSALSVSVAQSPPAWLAQFAAESQAMTARTGRPAVSVVVWSMLLPVGAAASVRNVAGDQLPGTAMLLMDWLASMAPAPSRQSKAIGEVEQSTLFTPSTMLCVAPA